MWLIDFIPPALLHIITVAGVIGTLVGVFLPLLPHRTLVQLVSVLLLVFGIYIEGGLTEKAKWQQKVDKQNVKIAELSANANKVTIHVLTRYIDRVKVVKEKGDVIIKEVTKYVPKSADDACTINTGFVLLHNAAAKNEFPPAPGDINAAASGVTLSSVGEIVAVNYNIYHQTATQLLSLQDWVREQEKLYNGKDKK